jgi:hypothetical protein
MTDDKGAGKLAEELFREWWLNNSELGLTRSGIGFHAFTSGFNAGRKAERERCLSIVQAVMCVEDDLLNDIGKGIVKTIKTGGQDGE